MSQTPDPPDEPLLRVMALHALAYCERLFYLEEVEEIRVADDRVFAGRADHRELELDSGDERREFTLTSEALGLTGKVDAVRHREGGWVPYEFKRGRVRRGDEGVDEAWESDRIQVCAYAMLLEEETGRPVVEGRVRYLKDEVTVRVPLDDAARAEVRAAIARARTLRRETQRPPVTEHARLCLHCSLAPVCLPEEERLAAALVELEEPPADQQNGGAVAARPETIRLFPEHPQGHVLHVTRHDVKVSRRVETITIKDREGELIAEQPVHDLSGVVIHGYAQVTTQAIHLLASHGVSLHWLTPGGTYAGGLSSGAGGVQRRLRQYAALSQDDERLALARRGCLAKVEAQLRYLLRLSRTEEARREVIAPQLTVLRQCLSGLTRATDADTLRGHEGLAGRAYFEALPNFLLDTVPPALRPAGRSRRPPRDPFNCLLSFGYGMLYRSVMESVLAVGLEPALGYHHTPRSAAHPLVLDLMELFRVPLVDMPVLGSFNRGQWSADAADFTITKSKVWLADAGRRKAIALFERRLEDTWKHPVLGYSLSYARTIELEVRLLEKEWSGQPGLFARSRLR